MWSKPYTYTLTDSHKKWVVAKTQSKAAITIITNIGPGNVDAHGHDLPVGQSVLLELKVPTEVILTFGQSATIEVTYGE
jgi:hypothetical protein